MLTDNITTTQTAAIAAIIAAMESEIGLPAREEDPTKINYMEESEYNAMIDDIKDGWEKMATAIVSIIPTIMAHIVTNGEVGTVISDVVGATATQNNTGTGLIN